MSSVLIKDAKLIITPSHIKKGSIYIEEGKIVEFRSQEADTVIDGSGLAVVPGLINAHTHVAMNFLRGLAEDKPLMKWLEEDIWPAEKKATRELVHNAAVLGIAEALLSGTTSILDMYFYEEEIARAASRMGIRAWVGYGMLDNGDGEKAGAELKKAEKLIKFVRGLNDEKITPVVSPHAPYTCSRDLLIKAGELAEKLDLLYHIHVSETKAEVEESIRKRGKTPLSYLNSLGVVNERFVGAHGVWLTPRETVMLSKKKGSIVHNPTSNLKLGSGIAPVKKYIEAGINVALGTDGQASNNDLNMWDEIKLMALLQKVKDVTFSGMEALRSATISGARALKFTGGRIGEGAPADLVLIDTGAIQFQPVLSAGQTLNNIIYNTSRKDVKYVLVDGQVLVRNGKLAHEEIVRESVRKIGDMLQLYT